MLDRHACVSCLSGSNTRSTLLFFFPHSSSSEVTWCSRCVEGPDLGCYVVLCCVVLCLREGGREQAVL